MTDRYPYRHHGPAVHGSKLADYLISEANMIEDIEQLRAENALLPCPFCGGSSLVVRETYKPLKKFEVFCRGNYTRACDAAMWGETRDRAICEWNTRAALSADPEPASTITLYAMPPESAPKGCPVLVAGGIAMRKTGGEWFSGMCEPAFSRRLEWEPKWWAAIPQQNDTIAGETTE